MSVNSLKPKFNNRETYLAWRNVWKRLYMDISQDIRRRKHEAKEAQRRGNPGAGRLQKELVYARSDARKMMTLMKEAKLLRDRILTMRRELQEQRASFPKEIEAATADFHFNRGHLQFPDILPRWVLKAKGQSFYIDHIDATVPWSTRELDSGSTLGMIRFRKCRINIDKEGCATISQQI